VRSFAQPLQYIFAPISYGARTEADELWAVALRSTDLQKLRRPAKPIGSGAGGEHVIGRAGAQSGQAVGHFIKVVALRNLTILLLWSGMLTVILRRGFALDRSHDLSTSLDEEFLATACARVYMSEGRLPGSMDLRNKRHLTGSYHPTRRGLTTIQALALESRAKLGCAAQYGTDRQWSFRYSLATVYFYIKSPRVEVNPDTFKNLDSRRYRAQKF
jgi:hypothetical protein